MPFWLQLVLVAMGILLFVVTAGFRTTLVVAAALLVLNGFRSDAPFGAHSLAIVGAIVAGFAVAEVVADDSMIRGWLSRRGRAPSG
jgi:hypothetical protein